MARVLDLLFPRFCVACHAEGSYLCEKCSPAFSFETVPATCPFCHTSGSRSVCADCAPQVAIDGLIYAAPYADRRVRDLIHQWKFVGDRDAFEPLGKIIASRASFVLGLADAIVPVPLSTRRERSRGFNQAHWIAEMLSDASGIPLVHALTRGVHTTPRSQVDRLKRLVGDLDHVFAPRPPIPERVMVCDDVFTSGSTLDAAAKVLKEAGAKEAWGFVIAKS
ncbi:ComF family protein [Candidatus Uhrbacteria bacterium]|nr:ComF family protein [Candidatus Uhrbacteria bacterium]